MGVAIEIRALTRHFLKGGQRIEVLRGAELDLAPGESVALLGQRSEEHTSELQSTL